MKFTGMYAIGCYYLTKFLFFISNYEAAKLGFMDLPLINGPCEGNVAFASVFITPLFFGENFYNTIFFGN